MKSFVRAMVDAESRPGVASISLIHGFPWGDVSEMGAKCLVLADTTELAERTAQEFGERLVRIRTETFMPQLSLEEALSVAMESTTPPVVLGDITDNPGRGSAGACNRILTLQIRFSADTCIWH